MSAWTSHLRWSGVVLAGLLLAGCSGGTQDLQHWVAQQKAKPGRHLPPLPVVKTFETYAYRDQGLRDPFAPPQKVAQSTRHVAGPHPDLHRPKQPLEYFTLDSLKMVGSIGTGKDRIALIEDPGEKIHRIHVGNYMGENYGRVTAVEQGSVALSELIPDGNGGWMQRKASIALDRQ